ncbi:MAG: tripartite tricarboxylate transporter substrate binding protein [Betaproteobacteria bacterium]|nr:tripartite tricarboxylate transporter substrate binding protein [Betaproteobacteria bacterium]
MNFVLLGTLAAVCFQGIAQAQSWPSKPIRVVVPYPPGGSTDLVPRLLQPRITAVLGQPLVVENRPGGDAMIGTDIVAKSAPDGYTILFTTPATHTQVTHMRKNVPYDPFNDFTPITAAVTQGSMVLVHPGLSVNNFNELIAYAKKNPGKLSYGTAGTGSNFHLAGQIIKQSTGIDWVHIPYKGGAPTQQALIAGEVPVAIFSNTSATPGLKAGKIKALAVLSQKRLKDWPEVPSINDFLPAFEKPGEWLGFYGPAKLPEAIVARLRTEIIAALNQPEIVQKLGAVGMEVLGNTPQEFAAMMWRDFEMNGKLLAATGVKPE